MKMLFLSIVLMTAVSLQAQTIMPLGIMDYNHTGIFNNYKKLNDSIPNKKWFVTTYTGISTGASFFKGGSATFIAAPIGIQLNRKLTDNWYAFAGLSVAPSYIDFNGSYMSPANNKAWSNSNFLKSNGLGIYSRAEMGLMYVNEAKTFSISGSIGIEKSSYPMMLYPVNNGRFTSTIPKN